MKSEPYPKERLVAPAIAIAWAAVGMPREYVKADKRQAVLPDCLATQCNDCGRAGALFITAVSRGVQTMCDVELPPSEVSEAYKQPIRCRGVMCLIVLPNEVNATTEMVEAEVLMSVIRAKLLTIPDWKFRIELLQGFIDKLNPPGLARGDRRDTEGPWRPSRPDAYTCQIRGPKNELVATFMRDGDLNLGAAAPGLLAACKKQHDAIDWLFSSLVAADKTFFPSKSPAWEAMEAGNKAIKEAERQ